MMADLFISNSFSLCSAAMSAHCCHVMAARLRCCLPVVPVVLVVQMGRRVIMPALLQIGLI